MGTSPWNKYRIIGEKGLLEISHIWGSRIRLELEGKIRDLARFDMALDSKLRDCDLFKLKVVVMQNRLKSRVIRAATAALCQKPAFMSVSLTVALVEILSVYIQIFRKKTILIGSS